jgi:hypothetical protein
MPGSKSNFLENELLDHWLGAAAYTAPANVFIGLFTVAPTDAGGGTEVTGGAYARVQVANNATQWPAASGGSKSNANAINFAQASADWGTVVAFGIFDALTSGNLLAWGWLGNDAGRLFLGEHTGDLITCPGHTFVNGDTVRLLDVPGSSLPAPLAVGTTYFIIAVSGITFQLSLTSGGSAIVLTGDGTGLIAKIAAKPVLTDDTASFAANQLIVSED